MLTNSEILMIFNLLFFKVGYDKNLKIIKGNVSIHSRGEGIEDSIKSLLFATYYEITPLIYKLEYSLRH